MQAVTEDLVRFATQTRLEDLPEDVVREAKRGFLDSAGCALAGTAAEKGKIAAALARRLGGPPESSVIGPGYRVSCANAACANGELINALDWDAVPHVHPVVIPPLLAVAESLHAPGRDLVVAGVVAQEIATRLSRALSRMAASLVEKGTTPDVFGNGNENILGGAAGAGRLLGLGAGPMAHALGIAAYLCPLPVCRDWEDTLPKSMIKYAPVGWIAQGAVTAALLAGQGFTGNPAVLDGEHGFAAFYNAGRWDPDAVVDGLGKRWLFLETQYKPYPCCRFLHSQLDCLEAILAENRIAADDIESITAWGLPFVANPNQWAVTTQVDVQFSMAFCLAAAACRLDPGSWQGFATLNNERVRSLMARVTVLVDPAAVAARRADRRSYRARVEVVAGGKTYRAETMYAGGTPFTDRMMSDGELVAKFRANAARFLTEDKISRAVDSFLDMEKVADAADLVATIVL